ncbi:MAG: hypothetical protein KF765_12305 [Parvibaculaceae bacterium]|nr:hypothetical protein [Parvibaculaceae bacterium]
MKAAFIGAALLLAAALQGCGTTERTAMGPVRLEQRGVEIPDAAFVCRDAPAKPGAFDGAELAVWINELWFARLDCAEKLKKAGEMHRQGKGD